MFAFLQVQQKADLRKMGSKPKTQINTGLNLLAEGVYILLIQLDCYIPSLWVFWRTSRLKAIAPAIVQAWHLGLERGQEALGLGVS